MRVKYFETGKRCFQNQTETKDYKPICQFGMNRLKRGQFYTEKVGNAGGIHVV